ncbi:MAG: glutamine--fructose-6-phosphate transaminase (isomerizing) [Pseudomonadota bacterium]
MCGIVGAVAERNVIPVLVEGLRRLEYRGYDSAGLAVLDEHGAIARHRTVGKVQALQDAIDRDPITGTRGIAHTRWATHGAPSEPNAHPQLSRQKIALVHNGIIENHEVLREELSALGYEFRSETDTEVVAHCVNHQLSQGKDLFAAVRATVARLEGAYALAVMCPEDPDCLIAARSGCPVVIGLGIEENFVASDVAALLPVTREFMFLEEGDVARITQTDIQVIDASGEAVERASHESALSADAAEKGEYRHFMLKEIYEQPLAIANTLDGRIHDDRVLDGIFGPDAEDVLSRTRQVHIVACGTSYHAGLIARYNIERIAGLPCVVEIASEYRYRGPVVTPGTLFVSISQSGETADTLAALRMGKELGYVGSVAICNSPESSLVRESDLSLMTRAGPEIGVASTKAFTTQLAALHMLSLVLARRTGNIGEEDERRLTHLLQHVPRQIENTLALDDRIRVLAEEFAEKHHALFLGRGTQFPVAMEGALKLKEISYIHAEAYAAGELKHGPLALVDADMPVIAVAPDNALLEKVKSNLMEVRARGGRLYVFADPTSGLEEDEQTTVITLPEGVTDSQAPMVYTIPLQLLAYHVAVLKGTDVDQPRNLAKSVTVE